LSQEFQIIDFEKDYLTKSAKGGRPLSHFLAQPVREQHACWLRAWEALVADGWLTKQDENIILIIHASIVRGNYGIRCVCDLHRLGAFRPDFIVTLIDDVHNEWWLTEHRAQGEIYRGRPTLEQLIMARRAEQMLGDMLALQVGGSTKHLVLAASHPRGTLGNYLFTAKKVAYLSFPITRPREMISENDDHSGIVAVNGFLKDVYQYQNAHRDIALVNPLAIDELELLGVLDGQANGAPAEDGLSPAAEEVEFSLDRRWDMTPFWPPDDSLSPGPIPEEHRRPLIRSQIEQAAGLIRTDVGWRDFRLVMQADALAVFSPVMARDRLSRGVEAEIMAAISEAKPVYVYQDPKLDPNKKLLEWIGKPGSMAADQKQQWVVVADSVTDMMDRLRA
jgi:hypothetical protein